MYTYYWRLSLKETFSNQEEDHLTAVKLILKKSNLLKDNTNKEELCIMKTLYFIILTLFKLSKNLRL